MFADRAKSFYQLLLLDFHRTFKRAREIYILNEAFL